MLNKLYQNVIQQVKGFSDREIGVIDESGVIIACSNTLRIGDSVDQNLLDQLSRNDILIDDNITYRIIGSQVKQESYIYVSGVDAISDSLAGVLSVSLSSVLEFYDEKFDKNNFIKNILLENIMSGDIYPKSKELKFAIEAPRVVILIRLLDRTDIFAYDIIQSLFPEKTKDFVVGIGENDIALVKEVKPTIEIRDIEKLCRSIIDTLNSEFYTKAVVGVGSIVNNLNDLSKSFKEARIAIEVGKVFDVEKNIISYNNLGLGRLIYYLPTSLCQTFLSEVFRKGSVDSFDHDTLFTIQKFFENNLNVSETSRKLFVHRNTLVYRLDKIRRMTGLDLKDFEDAIVFKVALMVKKYIDSNPTKF